ncbi:MAG: ABC transporter ATP-binding protein, partial [Microbacterium sp.]|nr:ABC transporter ATP-binding protein [Microbacterium sp.]
MSSTLTGTQDEDRSRLTREESRAIRKRSLRLLGSLVRPLKPQIVLAAVVLVISTALQVAGPILISIGLDRALPAVLDDADWMPTFVVGGIYLLAGALAAVLIAWYVIIAAKLTQAVLLDLRKRIFLHTQRLSLEFHESYTSGRIISRQTSDLDSIRELLDG